MCELILNGLSIHYMVGLSVPCQLRCLVASDIYEEFSHASACLGERNEAQEILLLGIVCCLPRR